MDTMAFLQWLQSSSSARAGVVKKVDYPSSSQVAARRARVAAFGSERPQPLRSTRRAVEKGTGAGHRQRPLLRYAPASEGNAVTAIFVLATQPQFLSPAPAHIGNRRLVERPLSSVSGRNDDMTFRRLIVLGGTCALVA